ncbi:MAG: hypothetical protein M0R46_12520 [Candidatus Muirbacterium halophilum]|nr:hypothetical protein [Candidatus Muirbacterium halophilum]MCK9476741.1 hypothetical protein [Candidatus Muirbacterium halophilum]
MNKEKKKKKINCILIKPLKNLLSLKMNFLPKLKNTINKDKFLRKD